MDSIAPFDPELGYQIDSEDMNTDSRIQKHLRLYHDAKPRNSIDKQKAPYFLHVWSGSTRKLLSKRNVSQESIALLNRLRILIIFPRSSFEARSQYRDEDDPIEFRDYYPVDSGPIPTPFPYSREHITFDHVIREGFFLKLPSDPEKLAQIRAKFALVDE